MSSSRFSAEAVGMCLETLLGDPGRCDAEEFERIVKATSAAGFRSVTMWSWRALDMGVTTTRKILDDAGVNVRLTEVRTRWAEGPGPAIDGIDPHLDLVAALGAETVLAISQYTAMDVGLGTEGFAALCERAAQRGLRVTIEFMPCRALCDLATAWQVVGGSGASNGGIDIDLMHWQHQPGGPDIDLLRSLPPQHVHYVQVCDAERSAPVHDEYIASALRARPLPGDGVVDIGAVLSALDSIGADPFFAMEVFNARLAAQGPEAMAKKLRRVADELFSGVPAGNQT
jgi:sugar phosphate isomerase/epimerase